MREFIDTLESSGRPSDAFALMAENLRKQEEASPLTPLIIPPRPSDLQEMTTARELSSIPAAARAEDVPSISPTVTDPQHAEEVEYTVDEVLEAAERAEKESEAEHDAGEDAMAGDEEKIAEEDNDAGKDLDTAMEVDLNMTVDGGAGGKRNITVAEGETPVKNAEGETPVSDSEGETPVVDIKRATPGSVVSEGETLANVEEGDPVEDVVEGETPVKNVSKGATPGTVDEGETPGKVVEGETPDVAAEPTSGGLQDIVDLDNEPEGDETPIDERLIRRRTRRSILDEVDEPMGAWELNLVGRGTRAGGDVPERLEAEARRLAIERKRKGKHEAQESPKKSKKNPASEKLMADAIKVPYAKTSSSPTFESEMEDESDQEEVPNFKRAEIWITKKLLESMEQFDDSKRAQTHKERSAAGKLVKSGKRYDSESLKHIESEEEFLSYIQDIGFEWLLDHSDYDVPVVAAREFFSTFRFKATTDPDADSISFRLFNIEHLMSVREWSLRMGLFTNEEDEEGIWNERMFGPPKNTPGFSPQSAWEAITHRKSGVFKTSASKGFHITNHLL